MKEYSKIFPFLWMHGESKDKVLLEIEKIKESGLSSFCIESRPHPYFCQDKWWDDFGFVLSEAKKRNMTVWLLDDKHYPTGTANDKIFERKDLWQENIIVTETDVVGEVKNAKFLLKMYGKEERLVTVAMFKVGKNNGLLFNTGKIVTQKVKNDVLYVDVPKGHFRILAAYTSHKCAAFNFIDMLNPKSTQLMIDEIYEPHYQHFSEYFGNTFVGFFSDEPRFGNGSVDENAMYTEYKMRGLGLYNGAYPWNNRIIDKLGIIDERLIFSLWFDFKNLQCADFRVRYMDYITCEYVENFSGKIGAWCKEHGVQYAGHIIEDAGAHVRTCCSAGHYFRAMQGLDYAGVDVVYRQIQKGYSECSCAFYKYPHYLDTGFYHFVLPKLASSAARLDMRKKGKALCETFGAYGWGETVPEMKWLVDFLISRGINYLIPHAFNPKEDDEDSPPYFYDGGRNPSYNSFKTLMNYATNLCEQFSGGETSANVAVLYHADAEWSGLHFQKVDEICKYLTQRQINFDIVPEYEIISVDKEGVHTISNNYDLLLIPYREYFKKEFLDKLSGNKNVWEMLSSKDLKIEQSFLKFINEKSFYSLEKKEKDLRIYEYLKDGKTYLFVFNEGIKQINNKIIVKNGKYFNLQDFACGIKTSGNIDDGIKISLRSGQAVVITICTERLCEKRIELKYYSSVNGELDYYISDNFGETWTLYKRSKELVDVSNYNNLPSYSGKVKIKGVFNAINNYHYFIDFGKNAFPIALTVNGKYVGERIGEPYLFDLEDCIIKGKNEFEIVISPTCVLHKRDAISHYGVIGKYGLESRPKLYVTK